MADIEKVIKCLEACTGDSGDCAGHTCPYWDFDGDIGCRTQMELDALALLKEQEAVKPYVTGRGESFETAETWWYACGNCNKPIDPNDKFCRHCGRPVKWE